MVFPRVMNDIRNITGSDLHMCAMVTLTQDIDGKSLRLFRSYSELISVYCPNLCVCVCVFVYVCVCV